MRDRLGMSQHELTYQLQQVASRLRKFRLWTNLTCTWLVLFVLFLAFLFWRPTDQTIDTVLMIAISIVVIATVVTWWRSMRFAQDPRWVARRIEAFFPNLDARLAAAIQQQPKAGSYRFGFMQESVFRQALSHHRDYDWRQLVSGDRLFFMRLAGLVALALLVTSLVSVSQGIGRIDWITAWSGWGPSRISVEPGDAEIERGTPLLVLARFSGRLPSEAKLELSYGESDPQHLPMKRSLDDPVFVSRLPSVENDLSYRVLYNSSASDIYLIKVFDYPNLERMDAEIVFPEYAERPPKLVEDTRRVTALEGSKLTVICRLNKPAVTAQLVDPAETLTLEPAANDPLKYTVSVTLSEPRRYKLRLEDSDGRQNRRPPELVVRVIRNEPTTIELVHPGRDMPVSPLEELDLEAKITDDVEVIARGIAYTFGDAEQVEIPLDGEDESVRHRLDFEALGAKPDQLMSYYFWADDVNAEGQTRRTMGDIFFAEVRPFEEIFRESDAPPGGGQQQGGAAQEAQELAELQKEIIAATWTLIRRTSIADEQFAADTEVIKRSQQMAVEQATELAKELTDEKSREHLNEAIVAMGQAIDRLTAAATGSDRDALLTALPPERQAYESLLKLRAREHNIAQSSQGQSSSSGRQAAQPNQRQLDQLELKDDPSQYEDQTTAEQTQEDPAEREVRQVLNRLRELARRQQDLNERLKQLDAELQQAQTEEERAELERQLKRLREEEEQILRDTEEVQQRLAESPDAEQSSETSERIESTREQIRQATDALREGQVAQATAEGTRAARQFEELRDEFRRRASGQFSEEMRKLQDAANELQQQQQKIGEELQELNEGNARTLRDDNTLSKDFQQQREQLEELLDDMQKLVEEAESSEPLLAKQLYDAFRETHQQQIDQMLDSAGELVRLGFPTEAAELERRAQTGISQLAERVDEAAQSVLGGETEALRRAQDTLQSLAEDLQSELDEQDPEPPAPTTAQESETPQEDSEQTSPQNPTGQSPGEQSSASQQQGRPQAGGSQRSGTESPSEQALEDLGSFLSGAANPSVIIGADFRDWSDRLRDVEEMVGDSQLRSEAAGIRQRARQLRAEFKRHSVTPNWDSVREMVAEPLQTLQMHINEELLLRQSKRALAPIDRDPVPAEYSEEVRLYYENLGTGK